MDPSAVDLSSLKLDNETALRLSKEGAAILLMNVPVGCSFTIDYVTYTTAKLFQGVKMIPPGVHFIALSAPLQPGQAGAPSTGWFYHLDAQSVLVREWDPENQGLVELEDTKQVERLALGVQRFDFDAHLAAYALDKYQRWRNLSNYITSPILKRLQHTHFINLSAHKYESNSKLQTSGQTATAATTSSSSSSSSSASTSSISSSPISSASTSSHSSSSNKRPQAINEVRFSTLAAPDVRSLSLSEVTRLHMDKSWQFLDLVKQHGDSAGVLGELQYAFVLFLLGQDYQGFEQWKILVVMCCSCQQAIVTHALFFVQFIQVLTAQLNEVPKDFFLDPLSSDNFLRASLQSLYDVATPPYHTAALSGPTVSTEHLTNLERVAGLLRTLVLNKFGWDIGVEDIDPEDIVTVE